MTHATHRIRYAMIALVLAWLALVVLTRPAHGGWSADPVQVHATTALCPLVSASDDAGHGAIVVWQENTASGGLLRAMHLLANGDVDPAWGGPVAVSDAEVARGALGSVRDGVGGAYVWWMEGAQLYLTRIAPGGAIAAGWPARGRLIASLLGSGKRPGVVADGSGGVYLAWLGTSGVLPTYVVVRAMHLGPANTGKDGWPNGLRTLGATQFLGESVNTFAVDAAPDGGLWLAAETTVLGQGTYEPGAVRLVRFTAAGTPAGGWTGEGVALDAFRGDLLTTDPGWGPAPDMALTGVAHDGGAGAFVLYTSIGTSAEYTTSHPRLLRTGADGSPAPGWSPGGIALRDPNAALAGDDGGASFSLRALADGAGGVYVGLVGSLIHVPDYVLERYSATGAGLPGGFTLIPSGLELMARGDGGLLAGSVEPMGPTGPYDTGAFVQLEQTAPGDGFLEAHGEPAVLWYGDMGLTATGDGGSILAWSQVNERHGVFAVRLNPAGIVTGVPPTAGPAGLRAWFVRGAGVRVRASLAGAGEVRVRLLDLAGREVARGSSVPGVEWVLPGTGSLPSGIYFARASLGTQVIDSRVVVTR